MSGGNTGAKAATLTFMVGGEKDEFEHARKVLSGMGKNVFHCGKPGSGEIAKIVNNLILGINMCAASEALAIAEKMGMDLEVQKKICDVSSGRSWCMDFYNPVPGLTPTSPANRNYDDGFQCSLIKKDLNLAIDMATECGAETHMTETARNFFKEIEDQGYGQKDMGFTY